MFRHRVNAQTTSSGQADSATAAREKQIYGNAEPRALQFRGGRVTTPHLHFARTGPTTTRHMPAKRLPRSRSATTIAPRARRGTVGHNAGPTRVTDATHNRQAKYMHAPTQAQQCLPREKANTPKERPSAEIPRAGWRTARKRERPRRPADLRNRKICGIH